MTKKPIIGIIPTFNLTNEENNPYEDKASFVQMYSDKIKKSGGIPIGILENPEEYTSICDGYVWPGGSKILFEYIPILEDAIKNQKPLLGICLGAQAITTFLNVLEDQAKEPTKSFREIYDQNKTQNPYLKKLAEGNIHSHYVTKDADSINSVRHKVNINKQSLLYQILKKEEINVVSLHGVAIARCPKSLLASGLSEDGVIEAVEYIGNNSFILGVQWHPEIEEETALFDALILNTKKKYQTLVNKTHKMEEYFSIVTYTSEYDTPNSNMEYETSQAWEELKKFARQKGYYVDIESAYRSIEAQQEIWDSYIKENKQLVAEPGYSEHHTGLAIDICMKKDGVWLNELHPDLKECYAFLKEHCSEFGFILRYPEGKEAITGYGFEPWHFRYVGNPTLAKYIMNQNLTLEEYVEGNVLCRKLLK